MRSEHLPIPAFDRFRRVRFGAHLIAGFCAYFALISLFHGEPHRRITIE